MRFAPAAVLPLLVLAASVDAATPITGRWRTAEGTAIVEVGRCGAQLCGRIVQLLVKPAGPPVDTRNPDKGLRARPLVGLPILSGFTDAGKDWRGQIYDPKAGKTYKSIVSRNADGTLKVQGCVAVFCRTQTWTPAR